MGQSGMVLGYGGAGAGEGGDGEGIKVKGLACRSWEAAWESGAPVQLAKNEKKDMMRSALEKEKSTKLTLLPSKLSSNRSRELLACLNVPYFLLLSLSAQAAHCFVITRSLVSSFRLTRLAKCKIIVVYIEHGMF